MASMFVFACLFLAIGCVFSHPTSPEREEQATDDSCGQCDPSQCATPKTCVAGTVPDRCDCCAVCGRAEGELCDLPNTQSLHGMCGDNLACRQRQDVPNEATCFCEHSETLCGTDGHTYIHLCSMLETVILEKKGDLKIASKGPCQSSPKIVSGPDHTKNHTGGFIALSCEAEGFPIPSIDWLYTRADGQIKYLPGDSEKVSVNLRGGPERYQITGWIQVMDIEKAHEGDYTCMAHNEHGSDKAQARVIVLETSDDRQRDL